MTLRLRNVQLDVPADGYDATVAFWSAALGARDTTTGSGPFTHLLGIRSLLGLHVQRLDDGPPRVHLDLDADDVDAEVARLVGLGARLVGAGPCRVLADPGGIVFCVCAGHGPDEELRIGDGEGARLHVLVLDVATDHAEVTAAFWSAALGVPAEHLDPPFDPYRRLEDVAVPGGSMRLLIQDIGPGAPARVHLDLHVADRPARDAEVERLVALGARTVGPDGHPWRILEDPVGTILCLVPDA